MPLLSMAEEKMPASDDVFSPHSVTRFGSGTTSEQLVIRLASFQRARLHRHNSIACSNQRLRPTLR